MAQGTKEVRRRKTELLTAEDQRKLKAYLRKFLTKIDAFEATGLYNLQTFGNIVKKGKGSPENVEILRKAINS